MIKFSDEIEQDIDSIIYYYKKQNIIKNLYKEIDRNYLYIENLMKKNKELKMKIDNIDKEVNDELYGHFKCVYDFLKIEDSYTTSELNKKVKDGRLEHLKDYLCEKSTKIAINKYLKEKINADIYRGEILNIDECYNLDDIDVDSYLM